MVQIFGMTENEVSLRQERTNYSSDIWNDQERGIIYCSAAENDLEKGFPLRHTADSRR